MLSVRWMGWKWSFALSNNAGKSCTFQAKSTDSCPTPPKSNTFRTKVSSNSIRTKRRTAAHDASTSNMKEPAKFLSNRKCYRIPSRTGNVQDVKVKSTCLKGEKELFVRTVIMRCATCAINSGGKWEVGRNMSARKKVKFLLSRRNSMKPNAAMALNAAPAANAIVITVGAMRISIAIVIWSASAAGTVTRIAVVNCWCTLEMV